MTFHKSSLKLASLYLAILMAISLLFSASIYQVSVNEWQRGLRRPLPSFEAPGSFGFSERVRTELQQDKYEAYEEARDHLITRLVLVNIIIVVAGGLLSYYFALRTLKPIEDAHEAQRIFAANASHELRTPITAMRSENEVALMDQNLTLDDAKELLSSNIEELEKLTSLAEGLLRLAKNEGGELEQENVAVTEIISEAMSRVAASAEAKNITLTLADSHKATVTGDKIGLTEALVTILDNAVKYSPEGAVVKVSSKTDNGQVSISVKDNGYGIEANDLPHIFDRFYRAEASRTKQGAGGYGLGLAIAKGIIEAHQGIISVASKPGKGSTFTITLTPVANNK